MPDSKREKKLKGEFTEQKKLFKRRATIYEKINNACKEANEKGTAIVEVDDKRFYLQSKDKADFYNTGYGFLRLKKYGLSFCEICTKDHGCQTVLLPGTKDLGLSPTTVEKRLAAWVTKVENIKTGETMFFNPEQVYYSQETEESWWVKLRNRA